MSDALFWSLTVLWAFAAFHVGERFRVNRVATYFGIMMVWLAVLLGAVATDLGWVWFPWYWLVTLGGTALFTYGIHDLFADKGES